MKTLHTVRWGLALAVLVSCTERDSTPTPSATNILRVAGVPGAEVIVPDSMVQAGLTLSALDDRIYDPGVRSIGTGFVAGPAGTTFAQPVTVRVPVDPRALAAWNGKPEQVRIFTRGDGEGRFHRLPTRLVDGGQFVEADVLHFSEFTAGIGLADVCMASGHANPCTSGLCTLDENGLVATQPLFDLLGTSLTTGATLTAAQALAVQACTDATDSTPQYPAAVAGLASLEDLLVASGAIDPSTLGTLVDSIRAIETSLLQIPSVNVSGLWLAAVPVGGKDRSLAVQLLQRPDGSVMGYVLGGADSWTVASSHVSGDHLTLRLRLHDTAVDQVYVVDGAVTPAASAGPMHLVGVVAQPAAVSGAAATSPVAWHTTTAPLTERRFTLIVDPLQGRSINVALAVSGESGADSGQIGIVAGTFTITPCPDTVCTGAISDASEDPDGHLVLLAETLAGNPATIDVAFGSPNASTSLGQTYSGHMQIIAGGSNITTTPVLGFRGNRTTSNDAAAVLALFGNVADDLVAHKDFSQFSALEPYAPVATYSHDGANPWIPVPDPNDPPTPPSTLLGFLKVQVDSFQVSAVEFTGFRNLSTVVDLRAPPLTTPSQEVGGVPVPVFTVDFDDRRVGTVNGVPGTEYMNGPVIPPFDWLRYLAVSSGGVTFSGNRLGAPDMVLPFLESESLDNLFSFTSYGVHTHAGESENPMGTESFKFSFEPPSTSLPVVVAPAELTVLMAVWDDPLSRAVCVDGKSADLIARSGPYSVAVQATNCTFSTSSLPLPFHQGDPLGTVALSHGTNPGYLLDFTVGTTMDRSFCPFSRLTPQAQARVLQIRNAHPYPEELTEPFICNAHQSEALAELSQEWRLVEGTAKRNADSPDRFVLKRTIPFDGTTNLLTPVYRMEASGTGDATTQHALHCSPPMWNAARPWWVCSLAGAPGRIVSIRVTATAAGADLEFDPSGPDLDAPDVFKAAQSSSNCDDGNPCTDDVERAPGVCEHFANTAPCATADPCSVDDRCHAQVCVHGRLRVCNDNNPCTDDSCNPAHGCVFTPNASHQACDDGNACTEGDVCANGACAGWPIECSDRNPCTDDSCNPQSGCVHVENGGTLHCRGGCDQAHGASDCDDHNNSTADVCDGTGTCRNPVVPCLSGLCACAPPEGSQGSSQDGADPDCLWQIAGGHSEDRDSCYQHCMLNEDGTLAFCKHHCARLVAREVVGTGVCAFCGAITPHIPGLPLGSCNVFVGSEYLGTPCVACAGNGDCDDYNLCTADTCVAGACVHAASGVWDCDDGNPCTLADHCEGKTCAGTLTNCDDHDASTIDWCSFDTGCHNDPINCDDADPCTGDFRDPSLGCRHDPLSDVSCEPTPEMCSRWAACDNGVCRTFARDFQPVDCDDFTPTTADGCQQGEGCQHHWAVDTVQIDNGAHSPGAHFGLYLPENPIRGTLTWEPGGGHEEWNPILRPANSHPAAWPVDVDADNDTIADDAEYLLADHFKPYLLFDSSEQEGDIYGQLAPWEPVILFQVQPVPPQGTGGHVDDLCSKLFNTVHSFGACDGSTEAKRVVKIVYLVLWDYDGGYGWCSSGCTDTHNGDAETLVVCAVAKGASGPALFEPAIIKAGDFFKYNDRILSERCIDGFNDHWTPGIYTCNEGLEPGSSQWNQSCGRGFHPAVYLSGQKHHVYLGIFGGDHCHTSEYTSFGCSDNLDGGGARRLSDLDNCPWPAGGVVSSSGVQRGNNVGEFDTYPPPSWGSQANHSAEYFMSGLEGCGHHGFFQDEWAWEHNGLNYGFCGGTFWNLDFCIPNLGLVSGALGPYVCKNSWDAWRVTACHTWSDSIRSHLFRIGSDESE